MTIRVAWMVLLHWLTGCCTKIKKSSQSSSFEWHIFVWLHWCVYDLYLAIPDIASSFCHLTDCTVINKCLELVECCRPSCGPASKKHPIKLAILKDASRKYRGMCLSSSVCHPLYWTCGDLELCSTRQTIHQSTSAPLSTFLGIFAPVTEMSAVLESRRGL